MQGSKIALVRSYLRVPQAAGQVKILIFLVKIKKFPIYANILSDAGQVPILRFSRPVMISLKNGSARPNRRAARAQDKKSFKRHLLLNH